MLRFSLASDGVYICPVCYQPGGSLLHCPSTLTISDMAVYFCCTILGVASTGRYPASCPVKPGLSSPAVFRHLQPRSSVLLIIYDFLFFIRFACKSRIFQSCFAANNSFLKENPTIVGNLTINYYNMSLSKIQSLNIIFYNNCSL